MNLQSYQKSIDITILIGEKLIFHGDLLPGLCKPLSFLAGLENCSNFAPGEMAEWSIAAVLKTVDLQGSGGSNPSLSANPYTAPRQRRFCFRKNRKLVCGFLQGSKKKETKSPCCIRIEASLKRDHDWKE